MKMTTRPEGKNNGHSTIWRRSGSRRYPRAGDSCSRCDGNPVVARHDRRQQRRHRQAGERLQRFTGRLQGGSDLQGRLRRHHERRNRRVPGRQSTGDHASVRGRHRHHDGGDRRREAGVQADGRDRRAVRSEGLPADHHRLLLDLQGRDAVVPVQLVFDSDVGEPRRAEEGRDRGNSQDLAGSVRRCQETESSRLRHLRFFQCVGNLGQSRAALGLA